MRTVEDSRNATRLAVVAVELLAVGLLTAGMLFLATPMAQAVTPFTEEAVSRGLVYVMQDHPQVAGHLGFGCGFADLDGDGDEDIVILGAVDGHVGLFENNGSGHFTDRSAGSGIPSMTENVGFAAADYDGDGDLDLYLTQIGAANVLARNDGGWTFTNTAAAAGVADLGAGEAPTFGDYDGDGWLDLFVANYNGLVPGTETINNKLYRNLGNGGFADVSAAQGVDSDALSFQSVWFDYDRDGDVDLYVSNDRAPQGFPPNELYRNDGGQFTDVSAASGAGVGLYSMGVACGDFDGNGWSDLYCTNIDPYVDGFNPLLLNQGDGSFVESSAVAGVGQFITSWGAIFFDLDNDSHLDLYVNNMFQPNTLYQGSGTFPTTEIAAAAGVTASIEPSFSSAVADIDGDGDLDLLVNNLAGNVELFINHEGETRNWVRYRFGGSVSGTGPNRFGVGGNVDTRVGTQWQLREVLAGGNGYLGQNELTLHVGLGTASVVDEAVVSWPGGAPVRTLTNLPAGRTWTLYPPDSLGDSDGDGTVDLTDFVLFADCFQAATFEPGCEMMDFENDSDVDLLDYNLFVAVFDLVPEDCNSNSIFDMREILIDPSLDLNNDGRLDECDTCGVCDDGLFCNGVETCVSGSCQPGSDPCAGQSCDEAGDVCIPPACDNDGVCEAGEDCDSCAADCPSFPLPATSCGNGLCEAGDGEDCVNCPQDCNGVQGGKPSRRYCCGFGGYSPVGCSFASCTSGGFSCTETPQGSGGSTCCGDLICESPEDSSSCGLDCGSSPACGDGSCDPGEDACSCSADCGPPPASEANLCTDGIDNDCDLAVDCADADCDGIDPACQSVDCSQFTNKSSCNAQATCRWDNKTKTCVPN